MDIDHFKQVNDSWSHAVGDRAIKAIADVIRQESRVTDTPARWGGEEFTLLLPDTDLVAAQQMCERLRQAVADYDCHYIAPGLNLTISLGLARAEDVEDEWQLLSGADKALYQAKARGRNRVVVFTEPLIEA